MREHHERRLAFTDAIHDAREHARRVQHGIEALARHVDGAPTPDEVDAANRVVGVLAGMADFVEGITQ